MNTDIELEKAIAEFVGAFEVVFHCDWPYTLTMIGAIGTDAETFIDPKVEDETEDWGSRGALLEKYRQLVSVMKSRGVEPIFPFPLDRMSSDDKQ